MNNLDHIAIFAAYAIWIWLILVVVYTGHDKASRAAYERMMADYAQRIDSAKTPGEKAVAEVSRAMWMASRTAPAPIWWL